MNEDVTIVLRPYEHPDDDAYIYSTWLRHAWVTEGRRTKKKTLWMKEKSDEINSLLHRGRVRVACIKETPSVIMGYVVFDSGGELKWICIKKQYRNQGIEELLLKKK